MRQNLGNEKVLAIPALSASYGKLPNALARARNEKVACSSQVTSSKKTAVFVVKTAVFRTFQSGLKDPQNGLALIWRYFFEGFKFLKNRDFEKPDLPNFFEAFYFGRKIDARGQGKLIIPKTRRILNFWDCF